MYSIIVERGDDSLQMWFDVPDLSIGRAQTNQLLLPSPEVSRRHARMVRKNDKYILVDLKSTNGTWINDERMRAPLIVRPDVDEIGICEFRLRISEHTRPGLGSRELPDSRTQVAFAGAGPGRAGRVARADATNMCDWRVAPAPRPLEERERDLLGAIHAALDDDAPRLVYADWLMERGDPRGELIALQCGGGSRGVERVGELLAQHGARWLSPFGDGTPCAFELSAHSARAMLPRVGGGERALPIAISRGFLAHPLCVSESRMARLNGEVFRLSPRVHVPIASHGGDGELRVVEAWTRAADGDDGEVTLRVPAACPWLGTPETWAREASERWWRRPRPAAAGGQGVDTARMSGLAYWGVSGDVAFIDAGADAAGR